LVCALGASLLLLLGALPASAAAEIFTVNTTADGLPPEGGESCTGAIGVECTLREAIAAADAEPGVDTISFAGIAAGSVLEIEESPLPDIFEQVTIDGGTAVGAIPGEPAIELVPTGFGSTEFVPGLNVRDGESTRIEGLAIGGFGQGIEVGPTEGGLPLETEICGNYLGVELDGETARPNEVGIEVEGNPAERPEGTIVGAPDAACEGNAIAGNSAYGVIDSGLRTTIAGNSVGVGPRPAGRILPNGTPATGSAGILASSAAVETMIGGTGPTGRDANVIAFNHGAGVFVEGWIGNVSIRQDSFFGNEGLGISILSDEKLAAPTIATARSPGVGRLEVAGTVNGKEDEEVEMDFYGSPTCDLSGAGEGQTFLGSERFPVEAGSNPYAMTLFVAVPGDDTAITATATRTPAGATTEFSQCAPYLPPPPEPGPEPKKAPDQGPPSPPPPVTDTVTPVNGETVVVAPEEGKVLIKLPGTKKYVKLEELKEIPIGAVIDATKGKVQLTSRDADGTEQTATFFGGVFKVKQKEGANLVVLELLDTGSCPAAGSALGAGLPNLLARPGRGTSGKLWGSGHGNFKTEGNQGSATVRGTIWLVEDRCDGTTFFKTRRGVVSVRDFVLHKTLSLPAGQSYVAGEG
jgi:CSLREA domain-containing protein